MTLVYELKFYDYWHLSSGLSAGARLDSTVVKDENGLPYASGKTIKGLVREMAEELSDEEFVKACFGLEGSTMGECYFLNATIKDDIQKEIVSNKLQDNLYDIIASTKVNKDGIAEDNSLREIEVVIPISLHGEIRDVSEKFKEKMQKSLSLIKRMGLNRNRGLGRCEFIVEDQK